jgi:GPH family glycoside/pentoside/hexuronide:cation symporter
VTRPDSFLAPSLARLWPWSLFAAMIAAAGLPIYINAPKFYTETYGVPLASLGLTLAALRLIDVVQDPVLGWLADAQRRARGLWVWVATVIMALAMFGLFAVPPPFAPLIWFALMMVGLFSAFSFLTIVFYAQGVAHSAHLGAGGHLRLAGWRETGSLLGVCTAAIAPTLLARVTAQPLTGFAIGFVAFALMATLSMRGNWRPGPPRPASPSIRRMILPVWGDPLARRLLILSLVNSAPVAITSTLFLFYVESVLEMPELSGVILLLFFLSAAISAPIWSRLGRQIGEKRVLAAGMSLSILAFFWATFLGVGDALPFVVISTLSGAALGADMVLLPALFARRLSELAAASESFGFGLWSFVSKLCLALAAAILLPALQSAGFSTTGPNTPAALGLLALLYAALPCGLKLISLGLLWSIPIERA